MTLTSATGILGRCPSVCLIWACCAWLHTERQLKWVNLIFLALYGYGIIDYAF